MMKRFRRFSSSKEAKWHPSPSSTVVTEEEEGSPASNRTEEPTHTTAGENGSSIMAEESTRSLTVEENRNNSIEESTIQTVTAEENDNETRENESSATIHRSNEIENVQTSTSRVQQRGVVDQFSDAQVLFD